jgi:cytidyltransferase-like protein
LSEVDRLPTGSIHGRFQPFHNGHLEYLQAALAMCEHLYLGITQFRRRRLVQVIGEPTALHRASPESNPLTYFERVIIMQAVLEEQGVTRDRYTIMPFPLEEPEDLPDFLPISVPVFTTVYDAWNERKISELSESGYTVHTLWTRNEKAIAGHRIRQMMVNGDPAWKRMVPSSTVEHLEGFEIPQRLRGMSGK